MMNRLQIAQGANQSWSKEKLRAPENYSYQPCMVCSLQQASVSQVECPRPTVGNNPVTAELAAGQKVLIGLLKHELSTSLESWHAFLEKENFQDSVSLKVLAPGWRSVLGLIKITNLGSFNSVRWRVNLHQALILILKQAFEKMSIQNKNSSQKSIKS